MSPASSRSGRAACLAILLTVLTTSSSAALAQSDEGLETPKPVPTLVVEITAETPGDADVPRAPSKEGPRPDFDGDGYADLAIGAPHARTGHVNAGEVHVLYGSVDGLDKRRRQFWGQDSPGIAERAEHGDQFGWSMAVGDFDGDAYTDLAIGARFEDRGAYEAGVVHVLYGGPGGLSADRSQLWNQASPGIADKPQRSDQFGWSMVAGDFDGDAYTDLAIGAHQEDLDMPNAGVVHILYGTPKGLKARRSQLWSQASPGIAEIPEENDQFGRAMAVADFDGDGRDDLAVGAQYEDRRVERAGVVHVLHGSRNGLTARGAQLWHQDSAGIAERAERRDQFGQSLAAADFDGDGFGDLVVGVWFEDYLTPLTNEGGFHVIYGSREGLRSKGNRFWNQDTRGTRDRTHPSDRFGQVLTVADFDGDGRDDLAVGSPSTDLGKGIHQNRGAVHIFPGSRRGLSSDGDRYLTQDTLGVLDRAEPHDHFGEVLASADFDGDGHADLAVGIPYEDRHARDDGTVYVVHGSQNGIAIDRDYLIDLTKESLQKRPRRGAHFGWSMSAERGYSGVPRTADPDI